MKDRVSNMDRVFFFYHNDLNNLFLSQEKSLNGYFTVACEIIQYGTLLAHLILPQASKEG